MGFNSFICSSLWDYLLLSTLENTCISENAMAKIEWGKILHNYQIYVCKYCQSCIGYVVQTAGLMLDYYFLKFIQEFLGNLAV